MAVFDAVINNADRKIGHLLPVVSPDGDTRLYGCDHGVCFSEDYKLRTVLWQGRGEKLSARSVEALRHLQEELVDGGLASELPRHLTGPEISATWDRINQLLDRATYPFPPDDWPAVPWPPF